MSTSTKLHLLRSVSAIALALALVASPARSQNLIGDTIQVVSLPGETFPLPRIYFTYKFTNTASVPVQVSFLDDLPNDLRWDTGYLPVIKHPLGAILGDGSDLDELIAGVNYGVGGVRATVDVLRIPPGRSEMTLRTLPTAFVGTINNDATISFGTGASVTIAATAIIRLTNPVPFVQAFAKSSVADYSVLTVGKTLTLNGTKAKIAGNVGVGAGVSAWLTNGVITGTYHVHPPATGTIGGVVTSTGLPVTPVLKDMSVIVKEALDLSNQAAALDPTQVFGTIDKTMTITGTTGTTVVLVDTVRFTGGTLTLQGGGDDYFVINVKNLVQMSGGSRMALSGGLRADHVVFNLLPGASGLWTSGQAEITGAILAVQKGNLIQLTGGGAIMASVACYDGYFSGGGLAAGFRFQ